VSDISRMMLSDDAYTIGPDSPRRIAALSDRSRQAGAPSWQRGLGGSPRAPPSHVLDPLSLLRGVDTMLKWALIFFIISLLAGVFGFTGIASGAAAVAKILFYIAVALFLLFLVLGLIALKAVK
jgi:uncharacterized membrane protein YtjA (UPF0391 family)